MVHLFSGYDQAQDCVFRDYILTKKTDWEEGKPMTPDQLMTYALNKYTVRKNCKIWGQKSAEEQIVALTSTIDELRDANLKLAKSLATVKKGNRQSNDPKDKKEKSRDKKQVDKLAKNKRKTPKIADIKPNDPQFGWIVTPPVSGAPLTKMVNGLPYHWCPNRKAWVRHLPEKCQMKGGEVDKPSKPKKDKKDGAGLSFTHAFAAIMQDAMKEEQSSDSE
jgi:hypothetical protein